MKAASPGLLLEEGGYTVYQVSQICDGELHFHLAGFDLADVEHGVDHADQALTGGNGFSEGLALALVETILQAFLEHGVITQDHTQGSAQFVRRYAQEIGFQLIQFLQFAVGSAQFLIVAGELADQGRILQRQSGLAGQALQETNSGGMELVRLLAVMGAKHAYQAAADNSRNQAKRADLLILGPGRGGLLMVLIGYDEAALQRSPQGRGIESLAEGGGAVALPLAVLAGQQAGIIEPQDTANRVRNLRRHAGRMLGLGDGPTYAVKSVNFGKPLAL